MGLDMYFSAKRYVSEYSEPEIQSKIKEICPGFTDSWKPNEITYQVGYWRKFNALHNWFVDNVQDGIDECQESYVPYEKILELYDILIRVKENHSLAGELLPTTSGFFFGSTEFDEWYFESLDYTIETLKPIVDAINDNVDFPYSFYYQSSW